MGYGNVQGTFNIGIVETDVQAIVNGITGYYGRTLTDVDNDIGGLSSYLYDGNSAVNYLNWIANNTGGLQSYLAGYSGGPLTDAASNLNSINSNTGSLQGYLAGYSGGPLTDTAGNTSSTASNTSNIAYYLYDWNTYQSAASLLGDIRNLLQRFNFDGNGRLLVSTN